jgi:MFS family permease
MSSSAIGDVSATKERTSVSAWWTLLVLFLCYTISSVDRNALSVLVEPIKADLKFSDSQMGLILGPAFTLCYALFGIPLGYAADRYPRRWVVYLGMTFWSVASAGTALAQSFLQMALARSSVGIGEAALGPCAYPLLAEKFPKHRLAIATAIYQSGITVGHSLSFMIVALVLTLTPAIHHFASILTSFESWQLVLLATGAPGLLLALLVFTIGERRTATPARMAGEGRPDRSDFLSFLKSKRQVLIPMVAGVSLIIMAGSGMTAWTPAYLQRNFAMTPVDFAPALSAASLASAITLIFKGAVLDWLFGRGIRDAHIRFYTWMLFLSAPAAMYIGLAKTPLIYVVLYGFINVITLPYMVFMVPSLHLITPPEYRGKVISFFLFIPLIATATGPVLIAFLTEHIFRDPKSLGWSMGLVLSVAVPSAFYLFRRALIPFTVSLDAATH